MPKRHWAQCVRQRLLPIVMALAVILGTATAVMVATAPPAHADTTTYSNLGYPYSGEPCEHSPYTATGAANYCSNYDWGPTPDTTLGWSESNALDQNYGNYSYRNCTDFVAWKLSQYGVPAADYTGLHNGGQWYDYAKNKGLAVGTTPKINAAAVVPGDPGHVAFVTAVNGDGTITVQEYNHDAAGDGDTWTGAPANRGFTEYVYFGQYMANPPTSGTGYSGIDAVASLQTSDGILHVYSGTASGKVEESWYGGGYTSVTTAPIAYDDGSAITSMSALLAPDGYLHVYSGTKAGDVYETWYGNGSGATTDKIVDIGVTVTALSSLIDKAGVIHVYSGGPDGIVRESWYGGGYTSITTNTIATLGPGVSITALSSLQASDGYLHVYSGTSGGLVNETWYGNGHGATNDPIVTKSGSITGLSSLQASDGVLHVYSGASTGDVYESWYGNGYTTITTDPLRSGSPVTGVSSLQAKDGYLHVYSSANNGGVYETWYGNGSGTTNDTLGAPTSSTTSISSLQAADGVFHVYMGTPNGDLYEFWYGGGYTSITIDPLVKGLS